jgi:hypothetical protein
MRKARNALLAEMWPLGIPRYAKDLADVKSVSDDTQVVPPSLEELLQWTYVEQDDNEGDSKRNKFLAYKCKAKCGREIISSFQGLFGNRV